MPSTLGTVLIVDDEAVNCKLLERWLKKAGAAVTLAEDGEDIIALMVDGDKTFDAVLVDENMRRMNGVQSE